MNGSRRERDPERAWERDRGRDRSRKREAERVGASEAERIRDDEDSGRFRHGARTDSLSELEELDLQDRER